MNLLQKLFSRQNPATRERAVYDVIVAQARQPVFYETFEVPDTVAGRFDMICLHAFFLFDRLSTEGEEVRAFSQNVHDELFRDMDRSLREMGVGDLSVGKRIRKMAQVLYGRSQAYKEALRLPEDEGKVALCKTLKRNVYDDAEVDPQLLDRFADYVMATHKGIASQTTADILERGPAFAALPMKG